MPFRYLQRCSFIYSVTFSMKHKVHIILTDLLHITLEQTYVQYTHYHCVLVKHLCNIQLSFVSFPAANMGISVASVALKIMLMPTRNRRTFCLTFPKKSVSYALEHMVNHEFHWTCILYICSGRTWDYHTDWSMNVFHFYLLLPLCGPIHNY